MDNSTPLEDRIEEARAMGAKAAKSGAINVNSFLPDMPEYKAWQEGYDANKPPPESAEEIAEAAAQGAYYATRGSGFTNPFPIGTAKRRAWQKAYDTTPKGVPQTSGPQGRSEDQHVADVQRMTVNASPVGGSVRNLGRTNGTNNTDPAELTGEMGTVITTIPPKYEKGIGNLAQLQAVGITSGKFADMRTVAADPYTEMLAASKRQGRAAREAEQPIGSNPYNAPESRLEGPAEAWVLGWREVDGEIQKRQLEKSVQEMQRIGDAKVWQGPHIIGPEVGELVRFEPVTREAVALAVFPFFLRMCYKNLESSKIENMETDLVAADASVRAADALLQALKK